MAHVPQRSGDSFQYPDPAGSRNVQASCVRQPETFHQRGDQVTAQTISEWLKKQMGAGEIPAHNMKAHSSFTDGDRFVNWRSALPVVVNKVW